MRKIRTGDEVMVIAGKNKGRTGKVTRVLNKNDKKGRDKGLWVVVEGLNMIKKHVRANPQMNKTGGIVQKEAPIHYSNVQLYDAASKKASRAGIRTLEDGKKVRFFKTTGEVADV